MRIAVTLSVGLCLIGCSNPSDISSRSIPSPTEIIAAARTQLPECLEGYEVRAEVVGKVKAR
jgi:hypothetical protein